MITTALVMLLYWYLAGRWLAVHGDLTRRRRALAWMGLFGAVFLIVYTTVLGYVGEWYAIGRRIGVVGYLSCTFFGQLLLVSRISNLERNGALQLPKWILRTMPGLCAAMLLLGLSTIPAPLIFSDMVTFEPVMEWNFSLLVLAFFPVTAYAWHADGFRPEFLVRSR